MKGVFFASVLFVAFYSNTEASMLSIEAPVKIKHRFESWLTEIKKYPKGQETIEAIEKCDNAVTIKHASYARNSAGRASTFLSSNLTNGVGMPADILMDGTIPAKGSHVTFDQFGNDLEFTAVQNLFHELSHARHYACGTWRYFDSEGQAIEDENIFRTQQQMVAGVLDFRIRNGIEGCMYEESREACLSFFEDDD